MSEPKPTPEFTKLLRDICREVDSWPEWTRSLDQQSGSYDSAEVAQ